MITDGKLIAAKTCAASATTALLMKNFAPLPDGNPQARKLPMRDFLALLRAGLNWRDLAAATVMSATLINLAIWLPEVIR
jgi:hypothetical protein